MLIFYVIFDKRCLFSAGVATSGQECGSQYSHPLTKYHYRSPQIPIIISVTSVWVIFSDVACPWHVFQWQQRGATHQSEENTEDPLGLLPPYVHDLGSDRTGVLFLKQNIQTTVTYLCFKSHEYYQRIKCSTNLDDRWKINSHVWINNIKPQ